MTIRTTWTRAKRFYSRHTFPAFLRAVARKSVHTLFPKADVVYCADLSSIDWAGYGQIEAYEVVARGRLDEIKLEEKNDLFENIDESLLLPQLKERFGKGAVLWLIKRGNRTAGKVWTLTGATVEPYYYFLMPKDVHLYNNIVFEAHRGQGINTALLVEVLRHLATQGCQRAFIETNLRNIRERRSLAKTPFVALGLARKKSRRGHNITRWVSRVPDIPHGKSR